MRTTQLLILGNGFDLHCGLKSSYAGFFRTSILNQIGEHFGLAQMQQGVSGFWEGLLLEYYKAFGNQDYGWCDIERIIKDTLWYIYYGDNRESNDINNGLWYRALNSAIYRQVPPEEVNSIEDPIIRYLFMACFNYLYCLSREQCHDLAKLDFLIKCLLQELHNFEKRFCKYLKACIFDKQNKPNENYVVNAVNLLAQLTGFTEPNYIGIHQIKSKERKQVIEEMDFGARISKWQIVNILTSDFANLVKTNILSFNYTNLFDDLAVESPCAYSNVHGKLCSKQCTDECKTSNVIFGIDDTLIQSQDSNTGLRLFSKTYRKMTDTSAPLSILPPNNNKPIEIKFYGHSLNEADYSYFQSIFDFYDLYANNNVSLVFYYSEGHEQNDAIYRLINSYGKTLANKDQGKNLMHKLLLENRLKIVELSD